VSRKHRNVLVAADRGRLIVNEKAEVSLRVSA